MTVKREQSYVPFGIAAKRFTSLGLHPKLDPQGNYLVRNYPGACHYNPKGPQCWYKTHQLNESWTRKQELEEFSRFLGYKNASVLEQRAEAARSGGPVYDITNYLYKRFDNEALDNLGFSKAKRFYNAIKNNNPPPGTYGYPFEKFEAGHKPKLQWTHVPSFEWSGSNRFKSKCESWSLPPNRYNADDHTGISATLAKVVSKRGPYDCFTGPRDETTIKNHFSRGNFKGANIWPRSLPSEIDKLKHSSKSKYGKFLKGPRFSKKGVPRNMMVDPVLCPRDPSEPGPGHYDISPITSCKKNQYAFNCSLLCVRPSLKASIHPGPGRYSLKQSICPTKTGESWVFKSKTTRTVFKVQNYRSF